MLSIVLDQVGLICKSRPAAVADIPLNATVSPLLVLVQPVLSHKTRAALVTAKRFVPIMKSFVHDQLGFLFVAFPTARMVTDMRFLERVRTFVRGQVASVKEARSTARMITGKISLTCMCRFVPRQAPRIAKALIASRMIAGVYLLVNGSLHRVRCWRREHMRFGLSCRSHMCHQALLTVGSHCLQIGARIHGSHNWWQ